MELCLSCPKQVAVGMSDKSSSRKDLDSCFEALRAVLTRKTRQPEREAPSCIALLFLPPESREMLIASQSLLSPARGTLPRPALGGVFLPWVTFSGDAAKYTQRRLIDALSVFLPQSN